MNLNQKSEIKELVKQNIEKYGSASKVATLCGVSDAAISQIIAGKYQTQGDDMWNKIAIALNYQFKDSKWNIANTIAKMQLESAFNTAKSQSIFIGVASKAGSGKTAVSREFYNNSGLNEHVYMIECGEWSGRRFLMVFARIISAEIKTTGYGYVQNSDIIYAIKNTLKPLAANKPLIIIDQANSLKASALRTLVHIYNQLEDVIGLVLLGTENLEFEIKKGVRLNKVGYDELDSRFGRKYIQLTGCTLSDCANICKANNINNNDKISNIFKECKPVRRRIADKDIEVVEDFRVLKRHIIVERELNL